MAVIGEHSEEKRKDWTRRGERMSWLSSGYERERERERERGMETSESKKKER